MKDVFYVEKYAANHSTVESLREIYSSFASKIETTDTVIDIPAGCGYGTELVGKGATLTVGFVQASEALSHAMIRHRTIKTTFCYSNYRHTLVAFPFDVVCCNWYDLEGGSDMTKLIRTLKRAGRMILIACPVDVNPTAIITDDEWQLQSVEHLTGSDIYIFTRKDGQNILG